MAAPNKRAKFADVGFSGLVVGLNAMNCVFVAFGSGSILSGLFSASLVGIFCVQKDIGLFPRLRTLFGAV